jgi:glycosyltransferase involved in cell wall biosynthesis
LTSKKLIFKSDRSKKLNILHVAPSLNVKDGGISTFVSGLINSLKNASNFYIITAKLKNKNTLFNINPKNFFYYKETFNLYKNYKIIKFLIVQSISKKKIDIIHVHGLWSFVNYLVSKYALKNNIPLIIHPHGMLESWALKQKFLKKKFAYLFYQKNVLQKASVIIASSKKESDSIKKLDLRKNITIIPNGINFLKKKIIHRYNKKILKALVLSRLHPGKGIDDLIKSWSGIRQNKWHLNIVGDGLANYVNYLKKLKNTLDYQNNISFLGHYTHDKKKKIFKNSDLFILPSYSENFGLSIIEAMNYGLPVITTTKTPWEKIKDYQCGWIIEPGKDSLTKFLPRILFSKPFMLESFSQKAYKFSKKFDWKIISKKYFKLYIKLSK